MKSSTNCNRNRLEDIQVDIENMFDHFFGNTNQAPAKRLMPPTNITESESKYTLMIELPGVNASDVSIEMQAGQLEIKGVKTIGETVEGERLLKSERRTGEFNRKFDFASQVDADRISAEFKSGLLTIELPKSEKILPRKIQIKSSDA